MDKKEEKIDQEESSGQQVKSNHTSNVWLVTFFVLFSLLTILVFHHSGKVFYDRVNFIFEKKNKKNQEENAVKIKKESKWGLLNRRFLIPLTKIVAFTILVLTFIIAVKVILLKLRERCEKKEFKKVDDIRSIFFYGRDNNEAEEEITKILRYLLFFCKKIIVINSNSMNCYEIEPILKYFDRDNPNGIRYFINFFRKYGSEESKSYEEAIRQFIKKKFHHYYYKNMNNSSFLLQNKDLCNYKNNACISFILSFFDFWYYIQSDAAKKNIIIGWDDKKQIDIEKEFKEKQETFDKIYEERFDFVVKEIKNFLNDVCSKNGFKDKNIDEFIKEEENELKESKLSCFEAVKKAETYKDEERNIVRFRYFLDDCQKNFFITLDDFFDYLLEKKNKVNEVKVLTDIQSPQLKNDEKNSLEFNEQNGQSNLDEQLLLNK